MAARGLFPRAYVELRSTVPRAALTAQPNGPIPNHAAFSSRVVEATLPLS